MTAILLTGLVAGLTGASGMAGAEDVSWLAEVTTPPSDLPKPWKPLTPLLTHKDGATITTREDWEARRQELLAAWQKALGPMPARPEKTPWKVLHREELSDVVRELVEYEGEPGVMVPAYILRPKGDTQPRSRPGIVVLHPTTAETFKPVAGLSGEPLRHSALMLARRGFVVVCPECFLWQNAADYNDAVAKHQKRHPKATGMAKMLYDAQRGVDLLLAQPDVDPQRIGAFGHSLGAKEVLYLTALDNRVRVGVSSEGGIALNSTNWDAGWYLGSMARDPSFPRDHHELLALIAPRPFLVIGGETGRGAADGKRSWPYLAAAQPIYRLHDQPVRLGLLNHGQGHPLTPEAWERCIEWLTAELQP